MTGVGNQLWFYLPRILVALAHLAGLVVAILLLTRKKGTPAVLALIAFALLLLLDVGSVARATFLDARLFRQLGPRTIPLVQGGLGCCCGGIDLIAVVLLVVALWQGLSSRAGDEPEETAQSEAVEPGA